VWREKGRRTKKGQKEEGFREIDNEKKSRGRRVYHDSGNAECKYLCDIGRLWGTKKTSL